MALSLVVSVEKYRDLKVIYSDTIQKIGYGFLLVFYSNVVPKTHLF